MKPRLALDVIDLVVFLDHTANRTEERLILV